MPQPAADQPPSIAELLKSSDWERRLADARKRREDVLRKRERGRDGDPAGQDASPEAWGSVLPLTMRIDADATELAVVPDAPDAAEKSLGEPSGKGVKFARLAGVGLLLCVAFATGYAFQRDVRSGSPTPVEMVPERPDTVPERPVDASQPSLIGGTKGELTLNFGPEIERATEPETRPSLALEEPPAAIVVSATPPPAPRQDPVAEVTSATIAPARGVLYLSGGAGDGKVRDALLSAGFEVRAAPNQALTAVEGEVRYFHPDDREEAAAAARVIDAAVRDYSSFRPAPPIGRIEIVLSDPD